MHHLGWESRKHLHELLSSQYFFGSHRHYDASSSNVRESFIISTSCIGASRSQPRKVSRIANEEDKDDDKQLILMRGRDVPASEPHYKSWICISHRKIEYGDN